MACKCVKPRYNKRPGMLVDGKWVEPNDTMDEPASCGECDGNQREPGPVRPFDKEADRQRRIAYTKKLMEGGR